MGGEEEVEILIGIIYKVIKKINYKSWCNVERSRGGGQISPKHIHTLMYVYVCIYENAIRKFITLYSNLNL